MHGGGELSARREIKEDAGAADSEVAVSATIQRTPSPGGLDGLL
jgi:hypothetical protein